MRKRFIRFALAAVIIVVIALGFVTWRILCGGYYGGSSQSSLRELASERLDRIEVVAQRADEVSSAITAARAAVKDTDQQDWIAKSLRAVEVGLDACPPDRDNWSARRELLLLADIPIRARQNDTCKRSIGEFFQRRMVRTLEGIPATRVGRGVRIWRLYNMGFVVKSADATIGFDIHPGRVFDNTMTKSQQRRLAELLDVAFVSHQHPDHLSREFVGQMLEAGKKVVLPEGIAKEIKGQNVVRLWDARTEPYTVGPVDIWPYPGRQFSIPPVRNCVYIVRTGGFLVMHQGDNDYSALYGKIAKEHRVDILLGNCWAGLNKCVTTIAPRLLITGHENEVKHVKGLRPGFWRTFKELDKLGLAPP